MHPSHLLVVGALLVVMALLRSRVDVLPLSTGLVYLAIGWLIGPAVLGVVHPDPFANTRALQVVFELSVLVSLFAVGLKLRVPLGDPAWRLPLRLAVPAMGLTIAGITLVGRGLLGLDWPVALLLGAILAPTDPVLASDVQVHDPRDRDRLRFGLTAEGGLNDGTAMPVVLGALTWLGLREQVDLGDWILRDLLWGAGAGLAIGWACGEAVGRGVLWLRDRRHEDPAAFEEFVALGLIASSYGLALAVDALGFLAVFTAGLALRRIEARRAPAAAPAAMVGSALGFVERIERIVEVVAVLMLGAMLSALIFDWRALLLGGLLILAIRPLSVFVGVAGMGLSLRERGLLAWFGIRGVGSLYYLMLPLAAGFARPQAEQLVSLVLPVLGLSVLVHGVSATPLMRWYRARRPRAATPPAGG